MLNIKISSSTIIKLSFSIVFFMTTFVEISAQAYYSKYFQNEMSGINQMNAAFVPEYGYLKFPVIGRFGGSFSATDGMSNFLFENGANGKLMTFMNKKVDADLFLNKLSPNTTFDQSLSFDVFSLGYFTSRNSFWSFNVGYRENLSLNLPFDFFRLAKKGMGSNNSVYDLSNIRFEQNNIADVSLGYSRLIGSKVRIGVNAKMLIGLTSARIKYDKFDVTLNQDKYSVDATGNIVLISDAISFPKDENNNFKFGDYDLNASKMKPAGYGAAFDFGITYNPIPRLKLSAAVNDIGSLKWKSTAVKHGVSTGNVTFNGFNSIDALNANVDAEVEQLKKDAKTLIQFKETPVTESYTYDLPTIMRLGAEFSLFNNPHHDVSLGVLYQSYKSSLKTTNELVGALNLRPLSWFMVSGTAAMLTKDYNRYGVSLNFSPCWINFYIASDFVVPNVNPQYVPIDKFNLNFETGLSIPFGKSRKKVAKVVPVIHPTHVIPIDTIVPVQHHDTLVVPAKVDTVPMHSDTLVVHPIDSAAIIHAADSVRMKLKMDSIATKAKTDSIAAEALKISQQAVVPVVVAPETTVSKATQPVAKKGTKSKIGKKPTQGKATLTTKKKVPAKTTATKK